MNVNQDLVGKTISGIIASPARPGCATEIWLLQFSDGTHVEFVSPGARKALRKSARRRDSGIKSRQAEAPQLALDVAC